MNAVQSLLEEAQCRWLARGYNLNGYERIYHIHIRKTGGTSINFMLLGLSGEEPKAVYERLARTPGHRQIAAGRVYVGWNVSLINRGNYFYGFSHAPVHQLKLPARTFTVTCFRDPVQRVVSHYRMLRSYARQGIEHPCMGIEGKWLGNSFNDFLERIPGEHLLAQIYMFSERLEVEQAIARARSVSHCIFLEDFVAGIQGLNRKTGLCLEPMHTRKGQEEVDIPEAALNRLKDQLSAEYQFLDEVRRICWAGRRYTEDSSLIWNGAIGTFAS